MEGEGFTVLGVEDDGLSPTRCLATTVIFVLLVLTALPNIADDARAQAANDSTNTIIDLQVAGNDFRILEVGAPGDISCSIRVDSGTQPVTRVVLKLPPGFNLDTSDFFNSKSNWTVTRDQSIITLEADMDSVAIKDDDTMELGFRASAQSASMVDATVTVDNPSLGSFAHSMDFTFLCVDADSVYETVVLEGKGYTLAVGEFSPDPASTRNPRDTYATKTGTDINGNTVSGAGYSTTVSDTDNIKKMVLLNPPTPELSSVETQGPEYTVHRSGENTDDISYTLTVTRYEPAGSEWNEQRVMLTDIQIPEPATEDNTGTQYSLVQTLTVNWKNLLNTRLKPLVIYLDTNANGEADQAVGFSWEPDSSGTTTIDWSDLSEQFNSNEETDKDGLDDRRIDDDDDNDYMSDMFERSFGLCPVHRGDAMAKGVLDNTNDTVLEIHNISSDEGSTWLDSRDGDKLPNEVDFDDDEDGVMDEVEVSHGTDPLDPLSYNEEDKNPVDDSDSNDDDGDDDQEDTAQENKEWYQQKLFGFLPFIYLIWIIIGAILIGLIVFQRRRSRIEPQLLPEDDEGEGDSKRRKRSLSYSSEDIPEEIVLPDWNFIKTEWFDKGGTDEEWEAYTKAVREYNIIIIENYLEK